ncbi:alpha/beta hydrolase-fold protein [Dyadobacter sp. Leaf189]|uniref:alpha/beta hydrolase-fold protein n=1 Tax=Dyadobacter sp. Leaf189 TaxID=1736295 RepID=UPI0006F5BDC9|nr:alpha/beta hydrolase-fold protein [Dyadobacter sp. Leaf189]KQS34106.1 esterase [Dyadobacter sp. Leaf189]
MKYLFSLALCLCAFRSLAQDNAETYPVDPASQQQANVPKGEILKFTFEQSKIFPGTWREYWVYVPAQYKPDQPACVYVNQDGIQWNAPTVFDNLIHSKEMPVTIGVFVMHGKVRAADPAKANDRFNRSFEYDGLGDAYAKFILEELLPEVEKQKTSDGRAIRLSKSGNDRAIGGSSSGAVCAFTAAWERPDAFTRVFSAIGTYVGLRGADRYHTLVRKFEPKPIRIYMQDGANDLNIYAGDWWMANQTMLRALTFAGYEVLHQWGEGGHNGKHGSAIFPEAMRYLWKNWPEPVKKGTSQNQVLSSILIEGQDWEAANDGAQVLAKKSKAKLGANRALSPDQTLLYETEPASHWVWSSQIQRDGTKAHRQKYGWLHVNDSEESALAGGLVCDMEGRIYVATAAGIQILDQTGRVNAIIPMPEGVPLKVAFGGKDSNELYATTSHKIYKRKLNTKSTAASETPTKPAPPKL